MAARTIELARDLANGECHAVALPVGDAVVFTERAPYKNGETPNEDRLAVIEIDNENCLLVVADGVGGSPAGEVASRTVIDRLVSSVLEPPDPVAIPAMLIAALEEADEEIKSKGNGSASTVVIAHLHRNTFKALHVGDSVAMLCGQRGKLKYETIAHSPVGYALEAGVLSEDEAFAHEDRHVVSNIIGGHDWHISLGGAVNLARRDTLILASDGLTDNLYQSEIIECVRKGNLKKCGETLAAVAGKRMVGEDDADEAGKPDDMTFILYRPKPE